MNSNFIGWRLAARFWALILIMLIAGQPLSGSRITPAYAQDDSRVVTLTIWRIVEFQNLDQGESGESGQGDYCANVGFTAPRVQGVENVCITRENAVTPVIEGVEPHGLFINGAWTIEPFWELSHEIPRAWGSQVTIDILAQDIDVGGFGFNDPLHGTKVIVDLPTKSWSGAGVQVTPSCSRSQGERGAIFFDIRVGARTGDTDGDGLLDSWELNGFDDDCDNLVDVNLPAFGAKFNHKDLFVELDWMPGLQPTPADIEEVKRAFFDAPEDAGTRASFIQHPPNVAGKSGKLTPRRGIQLWVSSIDNGIPGGNQVNTRTDVSGFNEAFYNIRRDNFTPAHRLIFHYALNSAAPTTSVGNASDDSTRETLVDLSQNWFADEWKGRKVTITGGTGSGQTATIIANSANVLTISPDEAWNIPPNATSTYQITVGLGWAEIGGNDIVLFPGPAIPSIYGGVFMHELGHNLNLHHGGFEDHNCKPNYVSVMTYVYAIGIPRFTGGGGFILDFSPPRFFLRGRGVAPLPSLEEGGLDERAPLDPTDGHNFFLFRQYNPNGIEGGALGGSCSDGMDNNGNMMVDREDPACHGIVPWRLNTPVDWDGDGNPDNPRTQANVDLPGNLNVTNPLLPPNFFHPSCDVTENRELSELQGFNDWLHISLPFRQFGDRANGAVNPVVVPEPTVQELLELREAIETELNPADIAITKSALPNTVSPGEQLVYNLTVTNNGPSDATGVIVTDPLATEVTFVSATASQGGCADSSTCDLGTLALGTSATVTITVNVNSTAPAGIITNTASVISNERDPDTTNNSATAETTIISTPLPIANDDNYNTLEDAALTISAPGVLGNDSDAESNPLIAVLVNSPQNGTLILNSDGSFSYTPNTGFIGSDNFTYKANDGTADSNVAIVTIIVESIATFCNNVTEIPTTECEALVALYNSTNGPSWTTNTNWLNTSTPCNWYGVTCDGEQPRHVIGLALSNNNLNGTIPPELGSLKSLKFLRLSNNQLSNIIPGQLGELTRLEELRLSNNNLRGHIPPQLGRLANLRNLNFNGNQLSGRLPPQFGNLLNLRVLDLSENQLSGSIPPELGDLDRLRALLLNNNNLNGRISLRLTRLDPAVFRLFHYNNTKLCEPSAKEFHDWLDRIRRHGGRVIGTGVRCAGEG